MEYWLNVCLSVSQYAPAEFARPQRSRSTIKRVPLLFRKDVFDHRRGHPRGYRIRSSQLPSSAARSSKRRRSPSIPVVSQTGA